MYFIAVEEIYFRLESSDNLWPPAKFLDRSGDVRLPAVTIGVNSFGGRTCSLEFTFLYGL
jgi:hypothetical protein